MEHAVDLGERVPNEVRISGLEYFAHGDKVEFGHFHNPTVFTAVDGVSVALAFGDDVSRAQGFGQRLTEPRNQLLIGNDRFGLDAHGQYTLEWSIYPRDTVDYYDYVNAVRADWGVNFQIDGGFTFLFEYAEQLPVMKWRNKTVDEFREMLSQLGVKYVSTDQPKSSRISTYAHGSAFFDELADSSRDYIVELVEKVRATGLDISVLLYAHVFISTEENAGVKYATSRILQDNGQQACFADNPLYPLFLPTLTNEYGQVMFNYPDKAMDDLGVDGIYFDESSYSSELFNYDGSWDGFSFQIDRFDFTVDKRISSNILTSLDFRLAFIDKVLAKGGKLVANFAPSSRTFSGRQLPHFVETGASPWLVAKAHLFSPVALGDPLARTGIADVANLRQHLCHGGLHYSYAHGPDWDGNPMQFMYPFTPIELHAGYLIGEERIITTIPGYFGWGDDSSIEGLHFDADGRLVEQTWETVTLSGMRFMRIDLEADHLAILLRRPSVHEDGGDMEPDGQVLPDGGSDEEIDSDHGFGDGDHSGDAGTAMDDGSHSGGASSGCGCAFGGNVMTESLWIVLMTLVIILCFMQREAR
jgi:hypothetical protein